MLFFHTTALLLSPLFICPYQRECVSLITSPLIKPNPKWHSSRGVSIRRHQIMTHVTMSGDSPKRKEIKNMGSYYRRPSAALERGGGFFVPGLQGYKLRTFIGIVVLIALVINRFPGYEVESSQLRSEFFGAACGIVFILRAFMENKMEKAVSDRYAAISSIRQSIVEDASASQHERNFTSINIFDSNLSDLHRFKPGLSDSMAKRFQQISEAILTVTPACTVLVLQRNGDVIGRLGLFEGAEENFFPGQVEIEDMALKILNSSSEYMLLLPSSCQQALLKNVGSTSILIGTPLSGKGIWSDTDLAWIEKIVGYL